MSLDDLDLDDLELNHCPCCGGDLIERDNGEIVCDGCGFVLDEKANEGWKKE